MTTQQEPGSIFRRGGPTRLMYYLGKYMPPSIAGVVVRGIAQILLAAKPANYYGALENLGHVLPPQTSEKELLQAVRRLFHYSTLSYYHLFHNLGRSEFSLETFQPRVEMSPEARGYLEQAVAAGRGLFLLGSHSSNFDLAGIALSYYAPSPPQALSYADPPPGFEFVNNLRRRGRGTITPISPDTLREAMQRLRSGGIVLTGVDRPLPNGSEPVTFFGETAHLPTGYMRIPLITDCLVMTVSFAYDGSVYRILANPPMEMVRSGNREDDVLVNVHRVLAQIEDFIRAAPDQWMVFSPVWPDGRDGDLAVDRSEVRT